MNGQDRIRRRFRVPPDVITAVLAALVVRVVFRLDTRGDPFFEILVADARSYFELGSRFAAGDFLFGREPLWFPPFYPVVVGTVFRLFGPEPDLVRLLQHGLGVVTAGLTADLGRRLAPGAGWGAGLLVALSPVLVFFEGQLLYASWAVFLTALFLNRFAAGLAGGGARAAAGSGAILGLLGWVRANSLLFLPVGTVLWARGRNARLGVIFAIVTLAMLVPLLLRNGLGAGVWTPLTVNGGLVFADGFHEDARGGRTQARSPDDFAPHGAYHREAEKRAGRSLSLAEASRLHRGWTLERMARNPGWVARLTYQKLRLLLNVREIDDNLGFETVRGRSWVLRWWPGPWAWVLLPAVVGVGVGVARRSAEANAVALYAAVYAASLLLFFVTSRYRLPLLVPLAALAGVGLAEIVGAARERRGSFLVPAAVALFAAGALFVLRDPGLRPSESVRLVAIGAAFEDAGYSREALEITDRAIRLGERSPAVYQNRAVTLLSLGREEEALRAVDLALRLDPELATAWNTRGTILARGGRIEEALPFFRRALELDPGDAAARANLAEAMAVLGQSP